MPFGTRKLNDGRDIGEIFFGTWKIPKDVCEGQVEQAFQIGFDNIDTAQTYRNEEEVGLAIEQSGLKRKNMWVTTKWSGTDGKGPEQSCKESLEKLGIDYIDLYLIHHPRLCQGDIPGTWKAMEQLKKAGYVKSIGVSNFSVSDLKELVASCTIKPVVNQILLHPYVISTTEPLLAYQEEQDILTEGYSILIPLTARPGGPVDEPVAAICKKYNILPEQVLLAWARAKGSIIITTSSRKERLENYLKVGDITLTDGEIEEIDRAGKYAELWDGRKAMVKETGKWLGLVALAGYAGWRMFF